MSKRIIPESELIINADGSAFHIHVLPEQLKDNILVCGDPERASMIASFFDTIEFDFQNREFHSIGGTYKGKPVMAMSHGIGSGNIDIIMNELDALANIDFKTRTVKDVHRSLNIVRIGTCGGLQPYVPVGTSIISEKSLGFDGVLNYYAGRNDICDLDFEKRFCEYVKWNPLFTKPYVVNSDKTLIEKLGRDDMVKGYTISAVGFYGPQGREIRLPLAEPELNSRIEKFEYNGGHITNYEMEGAALEGLAQLMGHRATTVCSVIANRVATNVNPNYKTALPDMIKKILDRLVED